MRPSLLLVALSLAAPALGQAPPAPSASARAPNEWVAGDDLIVLPHARIAFPVSPAGLRIVGTTEFSRKGDGLDNAVQYRSKDGAVWATAYLFFPGLAHSGLSAWATDNAMRATKTDVRLRDSRIVAAGGSPQAAIRRDYSGYIQGGVSSAAFIKAGHWIVAFRVTGPPARQQEVDAAMQALLDRSAFGPASPIHPARPVTVGECPDLGSKPAGLLPDPAQPDLLAMGSVAAFDAGGTEADDKQTGAKTFLPPRVPDSLCQSARLAIGETRIPVLRARPGPSPAVDGRTMLLAVLNDAGAFLEIVQLPKLERYVLISHDIGRSVVLGSFDGVPSDDQIRDLIENPRQPAGRVRVPVILAPGKGPEIQLPAGAPEGKKPPTA